MRAFSRRIPIKCQRKIPGKKWLPASLPGNHFYRWYYSEDAPLIRVSFQSPGIWFVFLLRFPVFPPFRREAYSNYPGDPSPCESNWFMSTKEKHSPTRYHIYIYVCLYIKLVHICIRIHRRDFYICFSRPSGPPSDGYLSSGWLVWMLVPGHVFTARFPHLLAFLPDTFVHTYIHTYLCYTIFCADKLFWRFDLFAHRWIIFFVKGNIAIVTFSCYVDIIMCGTLARKMDQVWIALYIGFSLWYTYIYNIIKLCFKIHRSINNLLQLFVNGLFICYLWLFICYYLIYFFNYCYCWF